MAFPVLRALSLCACCRQYPGAAAGRGLRSSHPAVSAFLEIAVGSACTSTFSRLAQRSLALRPAHSRRHLYVTRYTEGFSHFVTSMTAPLLPAGAFAGWGLHPLESAALSRRTQAAVIGYDVANGLSNTKATLVGLCRRGGIAPGLRATPSAVFRPAVRRGGVAVQRLRSPAACRRCRRRSIEREGREAGRPRELRQRGRSEDRKRQREPKGLHARFRAPRNRQIRLLRRSFVAPSLRRDDDAIASIRASAPVSGRPSAARRRGQIFNVQCVHAKHVHERLAPSLRAVSLPSLATRNYRRHNLQLLARHAGSPCVLSGGSPTPAFSIPSPDTTSSTTLADFSGLWHF